MAHGHLAAWKKAHVPLPARWIFGSPALPAVGSSGTAVATVVKAYRQLEFEGLAGGRPGQGTFITETLAAPSPSTSEALRVSLERWLRDADDAGLSEDAITALIAVVRYDMKREKVG